MKKVIMMATVAAGLAMASASHAQVLGGSGGLTGGLGGTIQPGGVFGGAGSIGGNLGGVVDGSRAVGAPTRALSRAERRAAAAQESATSDV